MKKRKVFQGFGSRVAQLRQARGWSQEELGERIGKSVNTVSNIERGVNLTGLDTIAKLAEEFGVPVAELFVASDPKTPKQARQREIAKVIGMLEDYDIESVKHAATLIAAALELRRAKRSKRR